MEVSSEYLSNAVTENSTTITITISNITLMIVLMIMVLLLLIIILLILMLLTFRVYDKAYQLRPCNHWVAFREEVSSFWRPGTEGGW
jgi:hypothetical protein